MARKPIYRQVFETLRDNGTLDHIKAEINAESSRYGKDFNFAWAQHFHLWRPLHDVYSRTKVYGISIPCMRKFRQLVMNYCQD